MKLTRRVAMFGAIAAGVRAAFGLASKGEYVWQAYKMKPAHDPKRWTRADFFNSAGLPEGFAWGVHVPKGCEHLDVKWGMLTLDEREMVSSLYFTNPDWIAGRQCAEEAARKFICGDWTLVQGHWHGDAGMQWRCNTIEKSPVL